MSNIRHVFTALVFLVACLGLMGSGCSTQPKLSPEEQMTLWESEGTVFRTGIKTKSSGHMREGEISYAVSPDGKRILFRTINPDEDGFWLLKLENGHLSRVPGETGRGWSMPSWSRDGKQVVAVSTKVQDNLYHFWEREIILLDSEDWSYRKLAIPLGGNYSPSFSANGKSVFFLKGIKLEYSTGVYALYDLYSYDLASDKEIPLTKERAYGMGSGYDDGQEIFFSGDGIKRLPSMHPNPVFRNQTQIGIYALNKANLSLRQVGIDQQDGFFDLILGGRDKAGNIYFTASSNLPTRSGNFRKSVHCCDSNGQNCIRLSHDIYFLGKVRIAYQTGEVFVDDRLGGDGFMGGEIVFRRLFQPFESQ